MTVLLHSDSGTPPREVSVMGILNVTPDSFSDGGRYTSVDRALRHALQMVKDGADIIDIGGESTRPGASAVSVGEELDRVIPVVEAIRREASVQVSVDSSKPEVMRAALDAGAGMINDVRALEAPGAMSIAANAAIPVCLMHMQGSPATMQGDPQYTDVVAEVLDYLRARADACIHAGVKAERIVLDPGFGFGKTLNHNLQLLRDLDRFAATGYSVLAGVSRKSMVAALQSRPDSDRLVGSVTLALFAARKGAHILRVHDVLETVDALRMESAPGGID